MENGQARNMNSVGSATEWVMQPEIGKMAPNTVREIEAISQEKSVTEMEKTGVFSEKTPLFDVTGNGIDSDVERREAVDSLREQNVKLSGMDNVAIGFTDKRQEKIEEGTIKEIKRIQEEAGDDMASLNAKVDDLSWSFLLNAYGRRQGDGLAGKGL